MFTFPKTISDCRTHNCSKKLKTSMKVLLLSLKFGMPLRTLLLMKVSVKAKGIVK